jgi:hypothetical protein
MQIKGYAGGLNMAMIKVLMKRPGEKAFEIKINNSLAVLQDSVGGFVESFTVAEDMVVLCDEDGRIKGKPYNCCVMGVDFVGTIIIAGVDGEEFGDVPIDLKEAKILFPELFL